MTVIGSVGGQKQTPRPQSSQPSLVLFQSLYIKATEQKKADSFLPVYRKARHSGSIQLLSAQWIQLRVCADIWWSICGTAVTDCVRGRVSLTYSQDILALNLQMTKGKGMIHQYFDRVF